MKTRLEYYQTGRGERVYFPNRAQIRLICSAEKSFSPQERGFTLILREVERAAEWVDNPRLPEKRKLRWNRVLLNYLDQLRKWLEEHPQDLESEDLATALSKLPEKYLKDFTSSLASKTPTKAVKVASHDAGKDR